jgi:hypothetical protein
MHPFLPIAEASVSHQEPMLAESVRTWRAEAAVLGEKTGAAPKVTKVTA